MIDVAIIIVSWNVRDYLSNCLRSVYPEINRPGVMGKVYVIDNRSTDGTVDLVRHLFPNVEMIANDENVGFGTANNQGMVAAEADKPRYYFLLNPDTVVQPGSIAKMVKFMDRTPAAGLVGARLLYGNGRFQHSAFRFPGIGQLVFDLFPIRPYRLYESRINGRYPRRFYRPNRRPFAVDHTLGATMMVRANVAEQTGGFDEAYALYCEEIDWGWRIRKAGWEIYAMPTVEITHYGGESSKQAPVQSMMALWRSRAQLYHQHHGRLKAKLATRLVTIGMTRKARRETDPAYQQAYLDIIDIWQGMSAK